MPVLRLPQEAMKLQGAKGSYLFYNLPQEQTTERSLNTDIRLIGASPSQI